MQCFRRGKSAVVLMLRASIFRSSHNLQESYTTQCSLGSAAARCQCLSGVGGTSVTTALSVLLWMVAWSICLWHFLSMPPTRTTVKTHAKEGWGPDCCRVCFQVPYSISGSVACTYNDIQLSPVQWHQNNLGYLADEIFCLHDSFGSTWALEASR